jgi:hypothetical protein
MQNNFFSLQKSSLLAAASIALASSVMLSSSAQAFSISFDSTSLSSNNPATGASAKVDFSFSQIDPNKVLLNLNLVNTTGQIPSFGKGATQATLVGFGFDLLNNISSFTYSPLSSTFTQLYGDQSLTSATVQGEAKLEPFGTFDVGIRSSGTGNFTGGNPQTGITASQFTNVSFTLIGSNLNAANLESAFLSGFQSGTLRAAARFQQVSGPGFSGASDKLLGGTISNGGTTPVPEPTTLVGIGLVAGAMAMSRRQQASKSA